jgi:filamentous hemagglutinin family protein
MNIKNILFFSFFLPSLSSALPNPNATEVQMGTVSFESLSQELQITASDGAHIQYFEGLNITEGETVRFIQPSSEATVINEIMTEVPTQIDGNLFGNGKVVLLNLSGIIFGGNAVVDVGKLHAIAGSDLLGAPGYGLSGAVENNGLIQAGEVVLAGSSVANTGTILVENGIAVLAAGGSFDLLSQNGNISVSLSAENPTAFGGVSDLIGQAVLQSGVVEASRASFHGNQVINTGSVKAQTVSMANFSSVISSQGTVSGNTLNLAGGVDSETGASVDMGAKLNKISTLTANGFFDSLTVRSSSSLTFGEKPEVGGDVNTLSVQNLDLRVDEGDLNVNQVPVPTDFKTDNALLLASKHSLVFAYDVDQLTHARKILYGQNLTIGSIVSEELKLGTTVSLDANSVSIDELSSTLSASVIQGLAKDNPSFEGFDSKGGLVELSSMTSQQLELLFQYGLFTGYSYFLQGPSDTDIVTEKLANAGGTSGVFGGSFAVVASSGATSGGATSTSSDSSGSGDSGSGDSGSESSEDSGESDSDSSSGGGKDGEKNGAKGEAKQARALGAVPFAPITTPIASPSASAILESALTAEIESRLSEYLDQ